MAKQVKDIKQYKFESNMYHQLYSNILKEVQELALRPNSPESDIIRLKYIEYNKLEKETWFGKNEKL